MVRVEGEAIIVETHTLTTRFERGVLVELRRRCDGRSFVQAPAEGGASLHLI